MRQTTVAENQAQLDIVYRKTVIIFLVLLASLLIYAGLGLFLIEPPGQADVPSKARVPVYVAAIFLGLGAIAIRRRMFREMKLQTVIAEGGVKAILEHLFRISVICAALGESIGVLGLVLGIMSGERTDTIRLVVVGLLVIIFSFPRYNAWQGLIQYAESIGLH